MLLPAFPAVRGTAPVPGLHQSAPTHGWTFQPTTSVALPRSAIFPVMSVIWYLAFWFRRRRTPGRLFLLFLLFLADDEADCLRFLLLLLTDDLDDGKKRSRRDAREYGDSGAGTMVSQMMDSELVAFGLEEEG